MQVDIWISKSEILAVSHNRVYSAWCLGDFTKLADFVHQLLTRLLTLSALAKNIAKNTAQNDVAIGGQYETKYSL